MKLEIALCKGKKLYDKRDDMARRDAQRTSNAACATRDKGGVFGFDGDTEDLIASGGPEPPQNGKLKMN